MESETPIESGPLTPKLKEIMSGYREEFAHLEAALAESDKHGEFKLPGSLDLAHDEMVSTGPLAGRDIKRLIPKFGQSPYVAKAFSSSIRFGVENPDKGPEQLKILERYRLVPQLQEETIDMIADMQQVYLPLHQLGQGFAGELHAQASQDKSLCLQIANYIMAERHNPKEPEPLLLVLGQDWFDKGPASVGQVVLETILAGHVITPREFITDQMLSQKSAGQLGDWLRFAQKFNPDLDDTQFVEWAAGLYEAWPPELAKAFNLDTRKAKTEISRSITTRLKYWTYVNQPSQNLDDVENAWAQLLATRNVRLDLLKPRERFRIVEARAEQKKRKHRQSADAGKTALAGEVELDLVHFEIEERQPAPIFAVKKDDKGYYTLTDENGRGAAEVVEDFVAKFPGTATLREDLESAIDYIRTDITGKGIKKFEGTSYAFAEDKSTAYSLWRLKPKDAPGVPCHSKIMKSVRIGYIRMNDGRVGLVDVLTRDNKAYSRLF